ncbi:hypothetical protein JRC49_14810 [Clostridiales bacterium FE2011]|nr:hypothetical protein JRC49_14810 [Clostridiales bacterium FE2011]
MWCVFLSGSSALRPYYVILWPAFVALFTVVLLPNISNSLKSTSIKNQIIMYGLYLFCCAFSIAISANNNRSIVFTERLVLAFLFAIGVSACDDNYCRQRRIIEIFLLFLLGVSFVELLFKDIYQKVFLPLLDGQQGYYLRSGTFGLCIQGFTIGISKNGLWMSIGFALYYSKIISGNRKTINKIMLLLYLVMIFCTGKRSYSLIAIVLILWGVFLMRIGEDVGRKLIKIFLIFAGLGVGVVFLSQQLPALNTSIVRSLEFLEEGDISDGRFSTYTDAIASIPANPLGIGIDVSGLHNSYMQFILELGWLGGGISLYGFVRPFIRGFSKLKKVLCLDSLSDVDKEQLLFSMLFQGLILLAAFVAHPFIWHDVIMLFMIMQISMIKIINKYYNAGVDNISNQPKSNLISKYFK